MSDPKSTSVSVAHLLGEFLISLAGTDRAEQAEAGIRLRAALPVPPIGAVGPDIGGLSLEAQLLRHAELGLSTAPTAGHAARGADRRAYRAARQALEERLEMIFEATVRGEGIGAEWPLLVVPPKQVAAGDAPMISVGRASEPHA